MNRIIISKNKLENYKDEFIKNGQLILEDKEVKRKINLIKERKKLFGIF